MKSGVGKSWRRLVVALILHGFLGTSVHAALPGKIEGIDLHTQKMTQIEFAKAVHGTVILFLSAKCPCSQGHEKQILEIYRQYQTQGFNFVAIHSNYTESMEMVRTHFDSTAVPYPIIDDTKVQWADRLGAMKTPHAFVISPAGEVLFSGGVSDSKSGEHPRVHYLKNALAAISRGETPSPREVKTLGCAIKRP